MGLAVADADQHFVHRANGEEHSAIGEKMDLQHYLRVVRKHKWPIALFTAAITSLAAYYAFTATPIYRATSTLLIEQQKANVVSVEELYGVDTENTDYYQTQFELLKSRNLAERIISAVNLWNHPELSPSAVGSGTGSTELESAPADVSGVSDVSGASGVSSASSASGVSGASSASTVAGASTDSGVSGAAFDSSEPLGDALSLTGSAAQTPVERRREVVIGNFMQRLSIAPVRNTKLVSIGYESSDPLLAARVANMVGEQYILSYLDAKMDMTTQASGWLNERLGGLKVVLNESKQRLIEFKQANGLVDVDGSVGRLNEQELLLLTEELAIARSEFSAASDLYRDVESLRENPELLESVSAVQQDPLVQDVKTQQGQVQRQLDELLNRYGEKHPRVIDSQSQLASLNATLEGHMRRVAGSIESDFKLLRQRVATIEAKLAGGKDEIQAIGTKKFELDALEREVATNQELYDTFFSRMTEAKSADGLETANARITDFAVPPVNPVKPKKQLIIALAALASLVLSLLMAFLYEQMDDTIKSTNDVEEKLGTTLLGILPLVNNGLFSGGKNLPLNPAEITDKKGTFSESVNTIRTTLFMGEEHSPRKVIVVTSSVPGEGKSTTSINLAYSLAQLERVLLIDCDMRRPTIAKAAGFDKNVAGLSGLITDTASARDCIKRGVFDGTMDVLPSGTIPDQPLELLASRRFEKILEQLGEHYDRIIIDSAPTQAVSDALVLSKLADSVVYVVKSHETSIDLVKRGIQRLLQVKAKVAGVVITQVDIKKISSYGGDYYYQGYYDYYGYTEKSGKGRRPGNLRLTQQELLDIKTDESDFDLDFGLQPVSNPQPGITTADRVPARDSAFATKDTVVSAIDVSAQLDIPSTDVQRAQREQVRLARRSQKSFKDDLDII